MGRLIEGLWDCKYCDTKGIRGSKRECPNCARPRDDNTKFYMPSQIKYVPEEEAKKINRNPDWICQYCNCLNSDSKKVCKSCGSARTKENLDYFSNRTQREEPEQQEQERNFNNEGRDNNTTTKKRTNKSSNFFKKNWKLFVIIPVILVLLAGLINLLIPKTTEITITEFNWERTIEIERYQTVEENDWTLPEGARLKYTRQEISRYDTVLDHYETKSRQIQKQRISGYETYVVGYKDLGNGYFEEITAQRPIYEYYYVTEYYEEPVYVSVPIYQTKYYYEIDKWLFERNVKTNGTDKDPYWGEEKLAADERVSEKTEKYFILGTDKKNKTKRISVDYEEWRQLKIGQTVELKVSIFGNGEIIR